MVECLGDAAHVGQQFGKRDAGEQPRRVLRGVLLELALAFLEPHFERFQRQRHLNEELGDIQLGEVGVLEFLDVIEELAIGGAQPNAEILEEIAVRLDAANDADGPEFLEPLGLLARQFDDLEGALEPALSQLRLAHLPEGAGAEPIDDAKPRRQDLRLRRLWRLLRGHRARAVRRVNECGAIVTNGVWSAIGRIVSEL